MKNTNINKILHNLIYNDKIYVNFVKRCRNVERVKVYIIRSGIYIGKIFLNVIYSFIKMLPVERKITMLSRQSDKTNIDFELIEKEIKKRTSNIKIKVLCKVIRKDVKSRFLYCFYILKCMYHIGTSKVCVLDGYSIPISILKHRKNLEVIQIWHASGALKRFGYQAINKKEGRGNGVAKLMDMHKNYTHVIAPSKATGELFAEAFGVKKEKIVINALPRIDYLLKDEFTKQNIEQFYKEYPKYKNKKIILYVPTFRKDKENNIQELIKNIKNSKYQLIIKSHPLDKTKIKPNYKVDSKYTTYDLLKIANYIITDYSAVAFEASVLDKPIYFYVYDIEEYKKLRGLNIDLFEEMNNCTSTSIKEIMNSIENSKYDFKELNRFKTKYMGEDYYNNTSKLVDFIFKYLSEGQKDEQKNKNSTYEHNKEKLSI